MSENKKEYTLHKTERLCSEKQIEALFAGGESFIAYPLRIVYINRSNNESEEGSTVSILTSVSKKRFKRAVKRNRVKRLIREAYRLNKHALIDLAKEKNICIDIAFLYLKSELPTYLEIEKAIIKTTSTLKEKLETGNQVENPT